jgi:hypothetical protein
MSCNLPLGINIQVLACQNKFSTYNEYRFPTPAKAVKESLIKVINQNLLWDYYADFITLYFKRTTFAIRHVLVYL